MEVMERAFELERRGESVCHLEIGEPDFPPPPEVVEACRRAVAGGDTHYTDSRGLWELREAIAADARERTGADVAPERVLVTSGTSPAMLLVFGLLCEPGDEVVIGAPHYPCYPNFVRFCGATPVSVPTDPADGYQLDPERVERVLTSRTRAVVVGSPANPTGCLQRPGTLRGLARLGVPLVADEIYQGLVYDDAEVLSALALDADAFVLDGFSKRYAMTGFRLGWVVAPDWATRALQVAQQNLFISAGAFVQRAGLAALRHGEVTRVAMLEACRRRRTLLVDGLRELGFGVPHLPEGAFYVFADARRFTDDSLGFAFDLLERAHVGVTPGVDFGEGGEGWIRLCYAVSEATLETALERLRRVLA